MLRFLGSQTSFSETTDLGTGEGEGEKLWAVPAERWYDPSTELEPVWRNTGVMGGEPVQSPPARTSEKTSSSQPSLTAGKEAIIGLLKYTAFIGAAIMPDAGLSAVLKLPDAERVGVLGKYDVQLVSIGIMAGGDCWSIMVGLWWWA